MGKKQPGFLGIESYRKEIRISVYYRKNLGSGRRKIPLNFSG
jgi:hypothetical protein